MPGPPFIAYPLHLGSTTRYDSIPGSKLPKYHFLVWKIWTFAWYNGKSPNKFCWLFENIRILSHRKIWGFYGPSVPWLSSLSMPGSANPWCMAALLHPSAYPHTSRRCFHLQRLGGFMDVGKQAWRDIIYHLTWYHMIAEYWYYVYYVSFFPTLENNNLHQFNLDRIWLGNILILQIPNITITTQHFFVFRGTHSLEDLERWQQWAPVPWCG